MCINNCCSFRLPLLCRCVAPGPAFTQLTPQQSMIVLYNLTTLCSDLDPQVSTHSATSMVTRIRLAKNIKKWILDFLRRSLQLWLETLAITSTPQLFRHWEMKPLVCQLGSSPRSNLRTCWMSSAWWAVCRAGTKAKPTPSSACCCRQGLCRWRPTLLALFWNLIE